MPGTSSRNISNRFSSSSRFWDANPVTFPPGWAQIGNHAHANRVPNSAHDNRNCRRRSFCCERRRRAPGQDQVDRNRNQLGRQRGLSVIVSFRRAIIEPDISFLDPAELAQTLSEALGVLFAASIHVAMAAPNCHILEVSQGYMPMMWELFNEPFDMRPDGIVHAPDRPGLGFTLRADALERFRYVDGPEYKF
jgi:hypothetical protein